ncbi:MAG: (deoxy)nucleoside triphosphate pyrophosphohydrolase [Hungatella hathewayi]|uniref:(deoxy)nucleoside triphosphate pyrophosphohydrolase n=1 Tax=Hungatella TaxID=1649459 RepID=UPI00033AD0DC|nr:MULTISPECIES: (deoxy)nucleoside triphosphate pyrophosphohydrolase [Hungatella]MCI7381525.1 (deoxy)nucleoside triphosphate pyrophosphohydrolase [Hungatella sp.]MDY6240198.1 (deoxy)nucleoside triphosphate pyrophosphohydrolase [Hungatella hathewayi]CCZ63315.1 aDP-ribose pyrophosphatase [Hungatella hathewayi CAG:224]
MKTIEVVAALIVEKDKVLATQRGYGEFKDGWEFPGGKVELGETPERALQREIKEELDVEIEIVTYIDTVEYDYPQFHLIMHCYECRILNGQLMLKEHEASKWVSQNELNEIEWLAADKIVVERMRKRTK